MFASGMKKKEMAPKPPVPQPLLSKMMNKTIAAPSPIRPPRLQRLSSTVTPTTKFERFNNISVAKPQPNPRSKYTERKPIPPVIPSRTSNLRNTLTTSHMIGTGKFQDVVHSKQQSAQHFEKRKGPAPAPPANVVNNQQTPPKPPPRARMPLWTPGHTTDKSNLSKNRIRVPIWNRKPNVEKQQNFNAIQKPKDKIDPETTNVNPAFEEKGIQTIEAEILNHDMLIGDIKVILPSAPLIYEIDRSRDEIKKKTLLKARRKFDSSAEQQETHLTDLKEFLDRAAITKRSRKPQHSFGSDRKLLKSMDTILAMEVPKTESISDIKARIKKKENELLNLFETVETIHKTIRPDMKE